MLTVKKSSRTVAVGARAIEIEIEILEFRGRCKLTGTVAAVAEISTTGPLL